MSVKLQALVKLEVTALVDVEVESDGVRVKMDAPWQNSTSILRPKEVGGPLPNLLASTTETVRQIMLNAISEKLVIITRCRLMTKLRTLTKLLIRKR